MSELTISSHLCVWHFDLRDSHPVGNFTQPLLLLLFYILATEPRDSRLTCAISNTSTGLSCLYRFRFPLLAIIYFFVLIITPYICRFTTFPRIFYSLRDNFVHQNRSQPTYPLHNQTS